METAAESRKNENLGDFDRPNRNKNMKKFSTIAMITAVAAMFSLTTSAKAQSQVVGEDGIAASPKVRQMLNERKANSAVSAKAASVGYQAKADDGIAASPKVRQLLNERKTVASTLSTGVASAGYRATGEDGITASPKVRQQLNERGHARIMIAPLK